jgi:hypothetical protein
VGGRVGGREGGREGGYLCIHEVDIVQIEDSAMGIG